MLTFSLSGFGVSGGLLTAIVHTDIKHMEGLLPKRYGGDASEIPGARLILDSVTSNKVPWAIVTSGTTPLVTGVS